MKNKTPFYLLLLLALLSVQVGAQETSSPIRPDQVAIYPGCKKVPAGVERRTCEQEGLSAFVAEHLVYPQEALEKGLEGTIMVSLTIAENGRVSEARALRDLGAGCAQAAEAVLERMNSKRLRWTPAEKNGERISSAIVRPVRFVLPDAYRQVVAEEDKDVLEMVEEEVAVESPPPPPPPPPVRRPSPVEVVEEEPVRIPEDAMNMEQEITMEDVRRATHESIREPMEEVMEEEMTMEVAVEAAPPPPPPPPPPPSEHAEVYKVVEDMPRYYSPECEAMADKQERKSCSQAAMLAAVYDNLEYPVEAKENGVEGTTVVQFLVEKDGMLSNIKVVRDIGAGCGEEAMRVVEMMNHNGPNWLPGRQRGRTVPVQFNLPVKFKL